ncbi:hypothetical protein A3L12_03910 [Thermococcus sp. P6]|uniref:transglutaminase domain-containing protein n=1 Tax=Thermococcus sp. P6 TaxID=122420 RepID=UPI000B599766|nr:transglutaminase domain-containing protein [Thermococcus sp. P6]ASJ10504.1 hypothetical protein A3L12_03910 [Thermococcus sp. P6]
MVGRKYIAFLTLILISLVITSVVLGPAMIEVPPETRSLEGLLLSRLPPGNGSNETGPVTGIPVSRRLLITGAAHTHYLRLNVYTDYVNGVWTTRNATRIPSNVIAPPEVDVPHHTERDRITVFSFQPITGNLFTSLYTTRVDATGVEAIPGYNLFRTAFNVTSYSFSSVIYTFDSPYLRNLTAGNLTEYLQAPKDPRLVNLAGRIESGGSDYEKALAIAEYLRTHYRVGNAEPPNGTDRLTWFLFESGEGNAYDFASAFVVLARLEGLPARLVEGLYVEAVPQEQVVTERNRHFWAEVYFEKAGWLIFDPLHRDPNVHVPFELSVVPSRTALAPGSSGNVTVKFERVTGANSSLTVEAPSIGVFLANGSGIHDLTIKLREPGHYPVTAIATADEASQAAFGFVTVPGNLTVIPDPPAVNLTRGKGAVLKLHVNGTARNLGLETTSPLVERIEAFSGGFEVTLNAPPDYPNGLYIVDFKAVTGSEEYSIRIPVLLREPTAIDFSLPATPTAGDFLSINGTVSGVVSPPEKGKVPVFLNDGRRDVLIGYGNLSNGSFSVPVRIPEYLKPGVYPVEVSYNPPPGCGYLPSKAVRELRVRGLARFSLPELILVNPGNVTLVGALIDGAGDPVPDAGVTYHLDGNLTGSSTTLTDGRFPIRLSIPWLGGHSLTLEYGGSDDYSPATAKVRVAAVKFEVEEEVKVKAGKPVVISGRVLGIKNATLKAYLFPGKTYDLKIVNGRFNLTLEPFNSVGERSLEFRQGGRVLKRITIAVVSPVRIELLTGEARGGKIARVKFRVVDFKGDPVGGLPLNVSLGDLAFHATTNGSGIAVIEVPVGEREVNATVTVTFEGSGHYLPARESFHVLIGKKRSIPWPYIGLMVLMGILILRLRRKEEGEERTKERMLKIIFNNGIPLFREGEALDISIECDGEPELYVNGRPFGKERDFRLILPPGEHEVEARCNGMVEKARVRVVKSYNEAVVEYYERCFLPWARGEGVEVEEMTPREIAETLTDMMYPWEPIDALTDVFERARYSGGSVGREEFIRFYRSVLEVVGGGCGV